MGNKQTRDPKSPSDSTPPDPPASSADSKRDRSDNQCSDSKRARLHQEATAAPSGNSSSNSAGTPAIAAHGVSRREAGPGDDLFPVCTDCTCCHGYIFSCPCSALSEGKAKCTQCRYRFSPGAASRRTVAAAASAVDAPMMPTISRSPSVPGAGQSRGDTRHEWSVRVHPTVSVPYCRMRWPSTHPAVCFYF